MIATDDGEHLHSSVKPLLEKTDAERIDYMNGERSMPYKSATDIFLKMEDALKPRQRPLCLAICSNPFNGKSRLVEKFDAKHRGSERMGSETDHRPVLLIEAPPSAGESRLYGAILRPFGFPARGSVGGLMEQVHNLLTELRVRMLIIDEFHNLLLGGPIQQRQTMAALKALTNKPLFLSIVAAGTDDVLSALATSRQMSTRFSAEKLPIWSYDSCGRKLLETFEVRTPLKRRSNLATDRVLGETIMHASDGLLGNIDQIISKAAVAAIETGDERITIEIVESLEAVHNRQHGRFRA